MNLNLLRKRGSLAGPSAYSQSPVDEPDDEEESDDESDSEGDAAALQPDEETESTDESEPVGEPESQGQNRFQQIFSQAQAAPKGPLSDRLSQFLAKPVPTPQDTKPGKLNRLAAILGGASEGYQHGASAGIKTATSVLDRPFNQRLQTYKMEGQNLEKGADIESKNMGRAASFAKTAMLDEHNKKVEELHAADTEARSAHWDQLSKTANEKAKRAGFTKTVGTDGHMYYTRPGANGTVESLDGGKMGESIPEKTKRLLEEFTQKEKIKGNVQQGLEGTRQKNRLSLEETRQKNRESIETDKAANTQIGQNKKAAIDQQLIEDRGKVKNVPKTSETTVTDAEGKVTGKKVVKTGTGTQEEFVIMKDKDGNPRRVKPENVALFKKANGIK